MDTWYLSTTPNAAGTISRAATLGATIYQPISPWQTNALAQAGVALPAVVLASGQYVYTVIADDGTPTSASITTAGAPFVAGEQNAATQAANQATILANVHNALAALRAIQSQANTFQGQVGYTTANLASLNDLLSKCQTMAGALNTVAGDIIAMARWISNQFDGTT